GLVPNKRAQGGQGCCRADEGAHPNDQRVQPSRLLKAPCHQNRQDLNDDRDQNEKLVRIEKEKSHQNTV
ncbi:MAG: hypothetical protein AAFO58_10280, partial [Pseudomonadota bacterium]